MEQILTAEEFYNEDLTPLENMIAFAKLHVEAALKAKIKAMQNYYDEGGYSLDEMDAFSYKAYPLENIK